MPGPKRTVIPLEIEITVERGRDTSRAMRGLTREFETLGKRATRAANEQNRRRVRDAAQTEKTILRDKRRIEDEKLRLEKRGHRVRVRDLNQRIGLMRRERLEFTRQSREMQKSIRAEAMARQEAMRSRRRTLVTASTAAFAGGAVAAQQVSALRQLPTAQGSFASEEERRRELFRVSQEAALGAGSPERLGERIRQTGARTGVPLDELTRGVVLGQQQFSNVGLVTDNMDFLADTVLATGASFEEVVGLAGELQRQFNLSAEEIPEAIGFIREAAKDGSVEFGNFVNSFIPTMGAFVQQMDREGIPALKEFTAAAQARGESEPRSDVASTEFQAFLSVLNDPKQRARLRQVGVDVTDGRGNLRNLNDLFQEIATNDLLGNAEIFNTVFNERRARRFAGGLRASVLRGDSVLGEIQQIPGNVGRAQIRADAANALTRPEFVLPRQRVNRDAVLSRQFDEQFERTQGPIAFFQDLLAENVVASDRAKAIGAGVGGGLLTTLLFSGGRRALASGGNALARAATGVGGRALGALAGGSALAGTGVLAAGAGGFGLGTLLEREFGISTKVLDTLGVKIAGEDPRSSGGRITPEVAAAEAQRTDQQRRLLDTTEQSLNVLREIADSVSTPPFDGGDTGP
ncbi:MAG: phage tail tape measure protein [Myxococcota bacterium]